MIDVATRADDVKADGAALQRSPGLTIGVDIGGTKVAAGVVDPQGTILATTNVIRPPTTHTKPQA